MSTAKEIAECRERLAANRDLHEEPHVKTLEEIKAERPGFAERLAAIEAKLPAPPMHEPESEPEGELG